MFDWVPISNYANYYELTVLFCILVAFFQCGVGTIIRKDVASINAIWATALAFFLIFYIGYRPISVYFGDTMNYAREFSEFAHSRKPFQLEWNKEWIFYNLENWFAKHSDIHSFFLLCATLYVVPLWLASFRIFKNYLFLPLLVICCMFTFWQYGVNGVRNGIGASFFILAITYVKNPPVMLAIAFLGTGFHTSVYLMIGAAGLSWFINKSNYYLIGWVLCVILSYFVGDTIQQYFAGLNLMSGEERFSGYLTGDTMLGEVVQMEMKFRWDFLAYSSTGVIIGYYFIFVQKFKDEYYHWLYNTYLITNAFWVLIIRAAYSNRFAQISWFILPLVLIYPFMRKRFWENQEQMIGLAILVFYAFSFYTNIIKTNALSILF